MIPREEIEFSKQMADKGLACEVPADRMAELCRVYLAVMDAPIGTVATFPAGAHAVEVGIRMTALEQCIWDDGKCVRLVLEGEDGRS
jgi:hypothetical protein